MIDLQLLHLRPDLEEPGVEVVEMACQRVLGLLCLRLATSVLQHRMRLPL